MSTITREFTKEQLIDFATAILDVEKAMARHDLSGRESRAIAAIFEIAMASLEAEPVVITDDMAYAFHHALSDSSLGADEVEEIKTGLRAAFANVTAPPAPVSVPECFKRLLHHAYGMTMGHDWNKGTMAEHHRTKLCQAVEECRAAMLKSADGNSPVTPDGWVACSEQMPDIGTEIFYFCQDDGLRDCGIVSSSNFSGKADAELYVHAEGYDLRFGVDITHWMPLPAAPQQEVK